MNNVSSSENTSESIPVPIVLAPSVVPPLRKGDEDIKAEERTQKPPPTGDWHRRWQ